MTPVPYRDVLWHITADHRSDKQGDDAAFRLQPLNDEDDLYRAAASGSDYPSSPFGLSLKELLGSTDSSTRWTRRRIPVYEARSIGRKLWETLPAEVTRSLQAQLADESRPLRLKISSTVSRINDLPWEWLTDGQELPLALHPEVRLVRSVPVHLQTPELTVNFPIRVLLVLTNPKDERLLDGNREMEAVRSRLEPPTYQVQVCWQPTLEALKQHLSSSPHIVHYIGHAGISHGEGNIILHDESQRTYWLSGDDLAQILSPTVRLICLSTCYTAPNYQLLGLPRLAHTSNERRLPTMIANQYPLNEAAVRAFWDTFYTSLIEQSGNINEAIHAARLATAQAEPAYADWASFTLIVRDRTGQALRIVPEQSAPVQEAFSAETRFGTRQSVELQAQFAGQLVNDLAEQIRVLGKDAPSILHRQLERETKRVSKLLDKLTDVSAS